MDQDGVCRYSAFIPLYPLGVLAGEMPLIWNGLPYIKQRKLHSIDMPNSLNFAFSYHTFAQVSTQLQAVAEPSEACLQLAALCCHMYRPCWKCRGRQKAARAANSFYWD